MRLSSLCRAAVAHKTPYAVLGVSRTASAHELRQAYLVKVKQLHPDSWAQLKNVSGDQSGDQCVCNSDEAEAEKQALAESFKNLQNAWYILQDPLRRRDYDHHDCGGRSHGSKQTKKQQSCQARAWYMQMRAEQTRRAKESIEQWESKVQGWRAMEIRHLSSLGQWPFTSYSH